MNTRKRTRRAATIDITDSIPVKQGRTKKTNSEPIISEMSNSNPGTDVPKANEIENEDANTAYETADGDELTQPLFPGSDPQDILAQADVLLAQIAAYDLENSLRQNNETAQQNTDTEQKPSTSTANNAPAETLNEQSSDQQRTEEGTNGSNNESLQSTSTANQSHYDDSVILIDDSVMPRPSRITTDEDVIFVTEYAQQQRVTAVVDLCDGDESELAKKKTTMPTALAASDQPAPVASLPTSPVASTSSGGIVVKCPVCLDSVPSDEIHSTICGHLYCGPCIKNTIKTRKKCPMCNRSLNAKQIHRIYFHN